MKEQEQELDNEEYWKAVKQIKQDENRSRRDDANIKFEQVAHHCKTEGFELIKCSDTHYQLLWPRPKTWILNIYPGNGRLYWDPNHGKGPYLRLRRDKRWNLGHVVHVAIVQWKASYGVHK